MQTVFAHKIETSDSGQVCRCFLKHGLGSKSFISIDIYNAMCSKKVLNVQRVTLPMLMNPSPAWSNTTSPSTAPVPRLTIDRRSLSSSASACTGAGSSLTSNTRRMLDRATTTLQSTRVTNSWRRDTAGKHCGVSLRLVANSTPSAGRISCRSACNTIDNERKMRTVVNYVSV